MLDIGDPRSSPHASIDLKAKTQRVQPLFTPWLNLDVMLCSPTLNFLTGHHENGRRLGSYYKALPATGEIG
jgi:hypothetical protein